MDLKEKVAIVTGASAGIGAAIVEALLKIGMKVVGFARRKERIENLVEDHDGKLFALSVDVTKPQELLDGFAWVTKHIGPVYVLVNNAGICPSSSVVTGDLGTWQKIFDTNFMSVAVACKESIRIMKEHAIGGYIINIGSVVGHYELGNPSIGMYRSSKCAVAAMTENIRIELARMESKIRITVLSPGLVRTEVFEACGYSNEKGEDIYAKNPHLLGEDIANTVVYLLLTPAHVNISELIIRSVGEDLTKAAF